MARMIAALAVMLMVWTVQPSMAQQPTSVNPTALSVKEEQLMNALKPGQTVQGRVSIPDGKSANVIAPGNKDWRAVHQGIMLWVGALSILGFAGALMLFYLKRGKIRTSKGMSGKTITRFSGLERFTHWLTASTFLVLAASGVNVTFGKFIIQPWLGDAMFGPWSQFAKFCHNYLSFPFMLGLVLMLLLWIKDNIPNRLDIAWFKAGGGILGDTHPPAARFNGGQKVIFWTVILGGLALTISGLMLLFPFRWTGLEGLQLSNIVHGVVGLVMIGAMLAHIYIGSVGMEGAFDAMGSGQVDVNWAKEHHSIWAEEQMKKEAGVPAGGNLKAAE
ncbi:MAG: formate dehydrogenase subunit gamma [Beijerinckiaceae bacterium]